MKFKHGLIFGFIGGVLADAYIDYRGRNRRSNQASYEKLTRSVDAYKEGWRDGKNWFITYHQTNHEGCDICPH